MSVLSVVDSTPPEHGGISETRHRTNEVKDLGLAGGVTVAVLAKLARRGDIDAGERVVAYITGEGLKTLDCARGTFETSEIEPTLASFEEASERVASVA